MTTTPPAAVAPLPTIGESLRTHRVTLWILAIYIPTVSLAVSAGVACHVYRTAAFVPTGGGAWRLLPLLLWGVYMALATAEVAYMELFLPRAPMAAPQALTDLGLIWVGMPAGWAAALAPFVAALRAWMLGVLVSLIVALIVAVVALWVWLVRTYAGGYTTTVGDGGSDWFLRLFLNCIKPYVEEPKPVSSTVQPNRPIV